jgi:hypothetical protein
MRRIGKFRLPVVGLTAISLSAGMGLFSQSATAAPPTVHSGSATMVPASTVSISAFRSHLGASDAARFDTLTTGQRSEAVALFSNPAVDSMSATQIAKEYPGATVTDSSTTTRVTLANTPGHLAARFALAASATTYYVHSSFSHTAKFLWIKNTSTLDYYYWTVNNQVVRDNYCTWHDSGFTAQQISNISVNHWVGGGLGHCYADVQINDLDVFNGVVTQQMDVNGGHGVYRTYFHDS